MLYLASQSSPILTVTFHLFSLLWLSLPQLLVVYQKLFKKQRKHQHRQQKEEGRGKKLLVIDRLVSLVYWLIHRLFRSSHRAVQGWSLLLFIHSSLVIMVVDYLVSFFTSLLVIMVYHWWLLVLVDDGCSCPGPYIFPCDVPCGVDVLSYNQGGSVSLSRRIYLSMTSPLTPISRSALWYRLHRALTYSCHSRACSLALDNALDTVNARLFVRYQCIKRGF